LTNQAGIMDPSKHKTLGSIPSTRGKNWQAIS
jgi:hypothetical protein